LRLLREPNLSARDVFYRVRQRVFDASKGQQFPAVSDGLLGEFVFRPSNTSVSAPPAVLSADADLLRQRAEVAFWESIPATGDPQRLRQLLEEYEQRFGPKGQFSTIARARLETLNSGSTSSTATSSSIAGNEARAAALNMASAACERGEALGCLESGRRYLNGLGTAWDRERAETFFQRACDAGAPAGCSNLGKWGFPVID